VKFLKIDAREALLALALIVVNAAQVCAGPINSQGESAGTGASGGQGSVLTFTCSDGIYFGFGTLDIEHYNTEAYSATSGVLNMASTSNPHTAVSLYYLISGGPGQTESPSGSFWYDNMVYGPIHQGDIYLDSFGLVFQSKNGHEIHLFGNGVPNDQSHGTGNSQGILHITFSPSSTPEPASVTLLGIGIVGLAGYGWRRRKQAATA
jgi:PEP-CTERM motif